MIKYKSYSIEKDYEYPYSGGRYIFYPTEEGIQHDADYNGDSYKYCGNCKWCSSIEEAMLLIDEIVPFFVETLGPLPIGGKPQRHITKFDWLLDAVKFAVKFNGTMSVSFFNP